MAMKVSPATHWSRSKKPHVFSWSRKDITGWNMIQTRAAWFMFQPYDGTARHGGDIDTTRLESDSKHTC